MQGIDKIYSNDIGISFYWKADAMKAHRKIQLIFRDTGFLLTIEELKSFATFCELACIKSNCADCKLGHDCKNLLLKTPSDKIDLAVSRNELTQITSLIDKTILKAEVRSWVWSSLN